MTAENPIPGVSWISTPTRKRSTDNPVDKPADKPAPASPDSKKTEPPKKPLVQRLIRTLAARIILGGLIVTGAGYAGIKIYENVPASHQNAETASPFDNGKLDTQRQTLVVGKNAREATPQETQVTINSPLPELKSKSDMKSPEELPTISIIPSIDLSKAGKVEIRREPTNQLWYGKEVPVPLNLYMSVENYGTPIGIFIPEGINTDNVEIFQIFSANRVSSIIEKFNLKDNKYIFVKILIGDLALTDAVNEATVIDSAHPTRGVNWLQDVLKITSKKKFNTSSENPTLFTTKGIPKSEIVVTVGYTDGTNGAFNPISPVVQDGNLLFSTPANSR